MVAWTLPANAFESRLRREPGRWACAADVKSWEPVLHTRVIPGPCIFSVSHYDFLTAEGNCLSLYHRKDLVTPRFSAYLSECDQVLMEAMSSSEN